MWGPVLERSPAVDEEGDVYRLPGAASCWGRLGLGALWHRLRQLHVARRRRRRGRSILGAGGLNYDPLSYAQNFDDGGIAAAEEATEPDFSSRFAPARHVGVARQAPGP